MTFELEPMQPGKSLLKQINNPLDHYDDRVVVFDEYSKTRMIKKTNSSMFIVMEMDHVNFIILVMIRTKKITCSEIRNMMKLLRH